MRAKGDYVSDIGVSQHITNNTDLINKKCVKNVKFYQEIKLQ